MGWETAKLGDVCEMIKRGVGPKYIETSGICVLNQKCVRDHQINYELARRHDLYSKKVNEERYIKIGDVLVNSTGTGTLGRVAQIRTAPPEPTTVDTHVTIVRPTPDLFYDDFFGYMLIKIEEEITSAGEGASGQTELVRTKLENEFFVSYPYSIPEQKRIVAILDQAFADIDLARAKTEQNLKNARELFESYLQQVFSQRGNGWEVKPLDSFSNIVNGYAFKSGDFAPDNEVKSIKITNVGVYEFVEESENYLPKDYAEEYMRYRAYEGDVVIALTRTIISSGLKVAVVPSSYDGALINQRVAAVHVNESVMPKKMLQAYLSTNMAIDYVRGNVNELMQPNLSIQDLRAFPIPVPPPSQARSVSLKISEIRVQTNKYISIYESKLEALGQLKKSILHKAFTGQLTAQDAT